jgi:hypothetical protein
MKCHGIHYFLMVKPPLTEAFYTLELSPILGSQAAKLQEVLSLQLLGPHS